MTFDWHVNDQRMMRNMKKRRTDIGRALNGSDLGSENKSTRFDIAGCRSTHNVGGGVIGSDQSPGVVNTYPRSCDVSKPFVLGGSAFPAEPHERPTETICMLFAAQDGARHATLAVTNGGSRQDAQRTASLDQQARFGGVAAVAILEGDGQQLIARGS